MRIHQIWLDKNIDCNNVPTKYIKNMMSWIDMYPEHKIWTNKDIPEIFTGFENYLPFFLNSLYYHIEKCDFVRYIILYKYGGLYCDMDFVSLNSFESVIKGRKICLFYEPCWYRYKVSNGIMYSEAGEKFWLDVLQKIVYNYVPQRNPIWNTGPEILDKIRRMYPISVYLEDSEKVMPKIIPVK